MSERIRQTRRSSSQLKPAEGERYVPIQARQHGDPRVVAWQVRAAERTLPSPHELQVLSHVAGNRAASRLIQRYTPDEVGGPGYSTDLSSIAYAAQLSALDLERRAALLTDEYWRKRYLWFASVYASFPRTHALPLVTRAVASLMLKPSYLGVRVATVYQGSPLVVLGTRGAWYHVRSGRHEGWIPRIFLFSPEVKLRSGRTGTGTTTGEAELGGRG